MVAESSTATAAALPVWWCLPFFRFFCCSLSGRRRR
jgi:hypothetical protein